VLFESVMLSFEVKAGSSPLPFDSPNHFEKSARMCSSARSAPLDPISGMVCLHG